MPLIDQFLSRAVKRGVLTVRYPDHPQRQFGAPDPAFRDVAIRFVDKATQRRILADPALGAAEAYMDGRLVIEEGDLLDFLALMTGNNRWEDGRGALGAGWLSRTTAAIFHRIGRINMARRARRNVAHHYDLSDRLYDLFLDADRQYSCAYFTEPTSTLEEAQDDKKIHIAAKLALRPGMHVLDIGCGWGGFALYLNREFGVEVTGITLSEEQLKVARARAEAAGVADRVRFELLDYRKVEGQFDRIVSVGMFEHVGPLHYRRFFERVRRLLTPDGVMLLHTIGRAGRPGVTDHFTAKYIFPGGYIPALSEIVAAHEGNRLFLTDVEVLRMHYAYTLHHWYDRLVANRAEAVRLYDERFYRMWQFYLAGSLVSFADGGLVVYQLQYARDRTSLPLTRDYMVDEERRLHRA